jgi:hypothetical protein
MFMRSSVSVSVVMAAVCVMMVMRMACNTTRVRVWIVRHMGVRMSPTREHRLRDQSSSE